MEGKKPAKDFELKASNGQTIRLSDLRGKNVLLYFYPKDMTPTCTTQACNLRDQTHDFAAYDTVILGISPDSVDRHKKFIEKYNLPFGLLADEGHKVAELYEVWQQKSMYGKQYMGIVRSTFLIDKAGMLVKEWRNVKVKGHVQEVLQWIKDHLDSR